MIRKKLKPRDLREFWKLKKLLWGVTEKTAELVVCRINDIRILKNEDSRGEGGEDDN